MAFRGATNLRDKSNSTDHETNEVKRFMHFFDIPNENSLFLRVSAVTVDRLILSRDIFDRFECLAHPRICWIFFSGCAQTKYRPLLIVFFSSSSFKSDNMCDV